MKDLEIWNACKTVLADEKKPLEVWRVAQATKMSEGEVIAALIRESSHGCVEFRFPPLPCAAITKIIERGPMEVMK